ncbi:hypothetical protein ACEPAG_7862 [Sanghuangporus baumii]
MFKRITRQKAVYIQQTIDEWTENFSDTDNLLAADADFGSTTWRENFSTFWRLWRNNAIKRDMKLIRSVNPYRGILESWMCAHKYTGQFDTVLKIVGDPPWLSMRMAS